MSANQLRERLLVSALRAGYELRISFGQGLASRRTLQKMKGDEPYTQER